VDTRVCQLEVVRSLDSVKGNWIFYYTDCELPQYSSTSFTHHPETLTPLPEAGSTGLFGGRLYCFVKLDWSVEWSVLGLCTRLKNPAQRSYQTAQDILLRRLLALQPLGRLNRASDCATKKWWH
jgi:hypothetical protein